MGEIDKKDLEELRSAYLELFEKVDKLVNAQNDQAASYLILEQWKQDHESLTLPRFKAELIELFKDEEVKQGIRNALGFDHIVDDNKKVNHVPDVGKTDHLEDQFTYKYPIPSNVGELKKQAEQDLAKAVFTILDFPFLSQDISEDWSTLRLDLLEAYTQWSAAIR